MGKIPSPRGRRINCQPRLRLLLFIVLAAVTSYYLLFSGPTPRLNVVPYYHDNKDSQPGAQNNKIPSDDGHDGKPLAANDKHEGEHKEEKKPGVDVADTLLNMDPTYKKLMEILKSSHLNIEDLRKWQDVDDQENYNDVAKGFETDGKRRDMGTISRLQSEKDLRKLWRYAYRTTADLESSNKIYGNTLATLDYKEDRTDAAAKNLRTDPKAKTDFSMDTPVRFNPYPDYNSNEWKKGKFAPYVACKGPTGEFGEDLIVFKGRPRNFPEPQLGSFSLLGLDSNLCWERDTRLGPYGLQRQIKKVGGEVEMFDWRAVNWGDLQQSCVELNAKRFNTSQSSPNDSSSAYPDKAVEAHKGKALSANTTKAKRHSPAEPLQPDMQPEAQRLNTREQWPTIVTKKAVSSSQFITEKRTAILLRSYTGKTYTENDKQIIRALISELSLKSGGEYEVFLLVHVKDNELRPFDDKDSYRRVLVDFIPVELHGITVLWNDQQVWDLYTELTDGRSKTVHTAQWLSVQKFSLDHPQFDFVWNWEMDFRYTGHHYDMLDKIVKFATKQPRKGLWERNERWYIPDYHGDYDTTFRKDIEERYGSETIWGPPDLPFISPAGPKPPVKTPEEDNYEWGVGEEADLITLGPMFNPNHSSWIIGDQIWGYADATHKSQDLPRRATIVTQSRMSKRLLDMMNNENIRGNHVASEMTPQTVALLHGFKAVFAPHPIFTDRDWTGKFLNYWFNTSPKGESGGYGSPMGWGRERRYQGNTWYYRAEPPNRLYNNWMGWADTSIGGEQWEQQNGRPCLPSILLHPVKDTTVTQSDHSTGFELYYG